MNTMTKTLTKHSIEQITSPVVDNTPTMFQHEDYEAPKKKIKTEIKSEIKTEPDDCSGNGGDSNTAVSHDGRNHSNDDNSNNNDNNNNNNNSSNIRDNSNSSNNNNNSNNNMMMSSLFTKAGFTTIRSRRQGHIVIQMQTSGRTI